MQKVFFDYFSSRSLKRSNRFLVTRLEKYICVFQFSTLFSRKISSYKIMCLTWNFIRLSALSSKQRRRKTNVRCRRLYSPPPPRLPISCKCAPPPPVPPCSSLLNLWTVQVQRVEGYQELSDKLRNLAKTPFILVPPSGMMHSRMYVDNITMCCLQASPSPS